MKKCELYLNWGTLSGRRRLLTVGETSLVFGNTGLLAQRAALVNCVTREKLLSELEEVRKTRRILDLKPVEGCGIGVDVMDIS
jgi:hypothetical protein